MEAQMPRDPDIQRLVRSRKSKQEILHLIFDRSIQGSRTKGLKMVDKAKRLVGMTSPFEGHRAQLVSFLEQVKSQYGQIVRFYEANNAMLNYF